MSSYSIWPTDRTLSDVITLDQNEPGSDGDEEVLYISQRSNITGASPLDCLISYPGHLLGGCYSSAEMQSVYSSAPADLKFLEFYY